jgi:3-deoxy-manno-octulosonate cytidylyltransferase (CMP-KDO synthetase)
MFKPVDYTEHQSKSTVVAIIPARFNSTRLPGKPLLDIGGKAMILHVVERTLSARNVDRAIVATDDQRIVETVSAAGFEAVMTRADHPSGSDRLAEVAATLEDTEIIVNVQGDEPFISPNTIDLAIEEIKTDKEVMMVTTSEPITDPSMVLSYAVVKVVTDRDGNALYFSRSPIPYPREAVIKHGSLEKALHEDTSLLRLFRKHTGFYVYRRKFLLDYASWPQSELERIESLEQLRVLERGLKIRVVEVSTHSIGIDTIEDLEMARRRFKT